VRNEENTFGRGSSQALVDPIPMDANACRGGEGEGPARGIGEIQKKEILNLSNKGGLRERSNEIRRGLSLV